MDLSNFKNIFKNNKQIPRQPDLHPNMSKIDLVKEIQKKKKIIIELKEMSRQLTQKEIRDWRQANQYALNIENPKRYHLYNIYYDAMLDDHLLGAIRNRKLKVMRTKFKIVDQKGKENPELTKLMQGRWFKKFMSLSLDSIFYGHSLIQFGDIIRDPKLKFVDIELVPRVHVIPEFHVIVKENMDEPKQGIDYSQPPFSDWVISVGDSKDLGLLLPVSKDVISKKYALQFWDQFGEIFGMPIRIGKSSTRNKKDLDKIESMLEEMGTAAWGLFPEGSEIEIVETKRGDAFNVYDKRVARANSEMSKAILGQTMTMDDGSSKSQALVHADVAEDISEADADFLKDVINDDLLPLLIKHGWQLNNYEFDWDHTYEYSPEEMKDVEEMLLTHYDIDPAYFVEKYNITITGIKESPLPSVEGEKKKLSLNLPSYPENHEHLYLADDNENTKVSDDLIRFLWDHRKEVFSWDYFNETSEILRDALARGWEEKKPLKLAKLSPSSVKIDYDSDDYMCLQMFEMNLFQFSAAKSASAVQELNELARKHENFSDFKQAAEKVTKVYNNNYLKTEYDFAYNTSNNAAKYHRIRTMKKEFPTWQYLTVGDERVRDSHKALHGMKFKADDPAFGSIYPPNGWGCRCYIKPLTGVTNNYSSKTDAVEALSKSGIDSKGNSEWDRMIKGGFNVNRAITRQIFDSNKFYVKENLTKKLTYKDQGLKSYSKLDNSKFPVKEITDRDRQFAETWHKKNSNDLFDYNKRKIIFTAETLKQSLSTKGKQNTIELIPDIIKNPNEVYLIEKGKKIRLQYIKYYKDFTMNIISDITDDNIIINSWNEVENSIIDKDIRKGILIKKVI